MKNLCCFVLLFVLSSFGIATAQSYAVNRKSVPVDPDSGVPIYFFGFNYCVPFAHGYRMTERLGLDHKQQIQTDIIHMARLGVNAFRVHVWDCEISDEKGNLVHNEHLDLLDYTIATMAQYGISTTVTAIALWGNGYPEPSDMSLPGFSLKVPKYRATFDSACVAAHKNYIGQLITHKNPYTQKSYINDPWVVALEINNEPEEADPQKSDSITMYVSSMCKVVHKAGWKKPILYNVAQCPNQIDAYLKAPIDGVTFQWYPSGLVANKSRKENFLPAVSHYDIPFANKKGMEGKLRWVYEFDAADIPGSYIYPAMARSLRSAGFQWATQFAYDPLAIADVNTDYQTHYLNLAYTPSKAISFLIAASAFRNLPSGVDYGPYPQSNKFGDFTVDYAQDLSLLNSDTLFAYSNNTHQKPVHIERLRHIAGNGSSPIVSYDGTGAYFLDQVAQGVWLLELYPDVIQVADPHGKASPRRKVAYIQNNLRTMRVDMKNHLGADFDLISVEDHKQVVQANEGQFDVYPGAYVLVKKGAQTPAHIASTYRSIPSNLPQVIVVHQAAKRAYIGEPLSVKAQVASPDKIKSVQLVYWDRTIDMRPVGGFDYQAFTDTLTDEMILDYLIVVHTDKQTLTWPQRFEGSPESWEFTNQSPYSTHIVPVSAPLVLYCSASGPRSGVELMGRPAGRWRMGGGILPSGINIGSGTQYVQVTPDKPIATSYNVLCVHSSGKSPLTITLIDSQGLRWRAKTVGSGEEQIPLSRFTPDLFKPLVEAFPPFSTLKPRVEQGAGRQWGNQVIHALLLHSEQPTIIYQISLNH